MGLRETGSLNLEEMGRRKTPRYPEKIRLRVTFRVAKPRRITIGLTHQRAGGSQRNMSGHYVVLTGIIAGALAFPAVRVASAIIARLGGGM